MKFLVLFLATSAFATASLIGRKSVDVKEDGTIVIRAENGKQILISKTHVPYGQKDIEIEVTGPHTIAKKIHIDDNNNQVEIEKGAIDDIGTVEGDRYKRSFLTGSQADVLDQILREYQGVVDEETYQHLLNRVRNAVLEGRISSNVLDFLQAVNEESKWNNLVSKHTILGQDVTNLDLTNYEISKKLGVNVNTGRRYDDIYRQQTGYPLSWNQLYWQQKYGQQGLFGQENILSSRGTDDQVPRTQLLRKLLRKIFDTEVLVNALNQQGVFEQGTLGQEQELDNVLLSQGIFNKEVLVEFIRNPVLRDLLIEKRIFNEDVLEKLLFTFETQGIIDQFLLEQLVNKQVLKFWLINQGIFQDILEQIVNNGVLGNGFGQELLVKLVNNPVLRNILVQHGIFDRDVLGKISYILRTKGIFSQILLDQLINKSVLRNLLSEEGIVDEKTLEQLVDNEILGLRVLLRTKFSQNIPKLSHKQLVGIVGNVPELAFDEIEDLPHGEDIVGIKITKTIVKPINSDISIMDALFGRQRGEYFNKFDHLKRTNENLNTKNLWRNLIYGQQRFGLNRGFNQGYFNPIQERQRLFNRYPVLEQQLL